MATSKKVAAVLDIDALVNVESSKGRPMSPLGSTFDTEWTRFGGKGLVIPVEYSETHNDSKGKPVAHTVNRGVISTWAKKRGYDVSISDKGTLKDTFTVGDTEYPAGTKVLRVILK